MSLCEICFRVNDRDVGSRGGHTRYCRLCNRLVNPQPPTRRPYGNEKRVRVARAMHVALRGMLPGWGRYRPQRLDYAILEDPFG